MFVIEIKELFMFRLSTLEEFDEILNDESRLEKLLNELEEYIMMHPYPDDHTDRGVILSILHYLAGR